MGKAQRTRRVPGAGLDGYVTAFLYPSYGYDCGRNDGLNLIDRRYP